MKTILIILALSLPVSAHAGARNYYNPQQNLTIIDNGRVSGVGTYNERTGRAWIMDLDNNDIYIQQRQSPGQTTIMRFGNDGTDVDIVPDEGEE